MVAKKTDISGRAAWAGRRRGQQTRGGRLTQQDLAMFRKMLLDKRQELLGDIHEMEAEVEANCTFDDLLSVTSGAFCDAVDAEDRMGAEITCGLLWAQTGLLGDIADALARIDRGTYGICEATGRAIGKPRLLACPWARYCIEHARSLEKARGPAVPGQRPKPAGLRGAAQVDDEEVYDRWAELDRQIGVRAATGIRSRFLELDDG